MCMVFAHVDCTLAVAKVIRKSTKVSRKNTYNMCMVFAHVDNTLAVQRLSSMPRK